MSRGRKPQDGAGFLRMANAHLIRPALDDIALKQALIECEDGMTHDALVRYALDLIPSVIEMGHLPENELIQSCRTVLGRWLAHDVPFQSALEIAGRFNQSARLHPPLQAKAYRALGQIAATPHVRHHALTASEYLIVMVNLIHPGILELVNQERLRQLQLMRARAAQTTPSR